MITLHDIQRFSDRIAEKFRPERIILFGSYASANGTIDSDVDLLVLMDFEGKAAHKAVEIVDTLHPTFALDLMVRRPGDVARRVALNDYFLKEVLSSGRVLYEAADA